jgi:NAD(P)-dependent dehydrogenase (short-subunit alcohol dehydrogenase family)
MRRLVIALSGLAIAGWIWSRATRRAYSFADKVVLITGGSRGLGLVLARQLCAEGAKVALIARDHGELTKAADELGRLGGKILPIPCDLLQREQISAALKEVVDRLGGLDVVVNNAGAIEVGPFEHMQREDFERSLSLHFWAPFNLITEAVPHLRRRKEARIVNIASIGGRVAVPHLAPYCASKFALVGLSDALRAELARNHIHVTTVTPGMMRTGSERNARFKGDHGAEFSWFSISTALPGGSIAAECAAAKILSACRHGLPSLTFPFTARTLIISNALFPNFTGGMMKIVNSLLPPPAGPKGNVSLSGWDLDRIP